MIWEITAREFAARLTILDGFCATADSQLEFCIGRSAPWIHGHLHFRRWRYRKLADVKAKPPKPPKPPAGPEQLGLALD